MGVERALERGRKRRSSNRIYVPRLPLLTRRVTWIVIEPI